MKLTVIGCTGSMSGPDSAASCYLLQFQDGEKTRFIVLDLGPGSFGALWKYIDPLDIDALILSHGHADHMADIISLEVHNRWHPGGAAKVLDIYGPEGIEERTMQIDGWGKPGSYEGIFEFHVVRPGSPFRIGKLLVEPFKAWHPVPTLGYRFTLEDENQEKTTFAYTGDTDLTSSMVEMAKDVDLLLCECGFTEADSTRGIHLSGERAGKLASLSGAKRVVLTHIQPWTSTDTVLQEVKRTWDGPLSLARPGQVHSV